MTKYHINKHGVPAPCRAKKGNCPLGGADSHFDNVEDAQAYADTQNAEEFSYLPGMDAGHNYDDVSHESYDEDKLEGLRGENVDLKYDGKKFSGEVIGLHYEEDGSPRNGIIVKGENGQVKHIKTHRLEEMSVGGTGGSGGSSGDFGGFSTPKELGTNQAQQFLDSGSVKEPEFKGADFYALDDLDTLYESHGKFISTAEYNPVQDAQAKFELVSNRAAAGKLYRYEEEGNYLEGYDDTFDENVSRLRHYLSTNTEDMYGVTYFENADEEGMFGEPASEVFEKEVNEYSKMRNYIDDLAVGLSKDYDNEIHNSGKKYTHEEKEEIRLGYRQALADKVGSFVSNYEDNNSYDDPFEFNKRYMYDRTNRREYLE